MEHIGTRKNSEEDTRWCWNREDRKVTSKEDIRMYQNKKDRKAT